MTEDKPPLPEPNDRLVGGDAILPGGLDDDDLHRALMGVMGIGAETSLAPESDDIITDPARLAKKVPPEVPETDDNVVWKYSGDLHQMGHAFGYNKPVELPGDIEGAHPTVEFNYREGAIWRLPHLPKGKRLIIDGIPKGNQNNDPAAPPRKIQIHVYQNTNGFLVADRVAEGNVMGTPTVGVREVKDPAGGPSQPQIDPDAPPSRPLSTNTSKQYATTYDMYTSEWGEEVQLGKINSEWFLGGDGPPWPHASGKITVSTPDDAGDQIKITFGKCDHWRKEPLTIRIVPDSTDELHPVFY